MLRFQQDVDSRSCIVNLASSYCIISSTFVLNTQTETLQVDLFLSAQLTYMSVQSGRKLEHQEETNRENKQQSHTGRAPGTLKCSKNGGIQQPGEIKLDNKRYQYVSQY